MMSMESYAGGFSSSALATRRLLSLDQAYGIYLTNKRLIVTKEKAEEGWCWEVNGASLLGTLTTKVKPYLNVSPREVEELNRCPKKFEAALDEVVGVELRHPTFLSKGHVTISLKSRKPYTLLLLNSTEDCAKEAFEAARALFEKNLPGVLRIT